MTRPLLRSGWDLRSSLLDGGEDLGEGKERALVISDHIHLRLIPAVGGGGAELLIVSVEVRDHLLAGGCGVGVESDDLVEDGHHAGDDCWVDLTPIRERDTVGIELSLPGLSVNHFAVAVLPPVAELVNKDPAVRGEIEESVGVGLSGVGTGEQHEGAVLFRLKDGPVRGAQDVGLFVVLAEGGNIFDEDSRYGEHASEAAGVHAGDEGVAGAGDFGAGGGHGGGVRWGLGGDLS